MGNQLVIPWLTNNQPRTWPHEERPPGLHALKEAQVFKLGFERTSSFYELISLSSLQRKFTLQVMSVFFSQVPPKKTVVAVHGRQRHLILQRTTTLKDKNLNTNPSPFWPRIPNTTLLSSKSLSNDRTLNRNENFKLHKIRTSQQ